MKPELEERNRKILEIAKPVLEKYREYIVDTGGNEVEDLLTRNTNPMTNVIVSHMESSVRGQVLALAKLQRAGLLP